MNAVINRITRMAERIAPSLRTSGANLGLAHAITAAMPAHCNESVSVTRTTAALVWRMKIMCKGREFHLELIAIELCRGNLLFVSPRLSAPPRRLCIFAPTLDSRLQRRHSVGPMTGAAMRWLRDRLRYFLPLAFGSAAISSCSLVFCQLESGLYSFMPLARTSVFLPRSF